MTIGERIKSFRERLDLTQEQLAEAVKTTKQTIHKYENNIVTNIPSERIAQLARILKTSPSVLMGWDENQAIIEREQSKAEARSILNDPNSTLAERKEAKIKEYAALYDRSLKASQNRGDVFHPDFDVYVGMMLHQESEKRRMGVELHDLLVAKYGTLEHMSNGTTYWYPFKGAHSLQDIAAHYNEDWGEEATPTTIAAHFDGDEYTKEELDKIKDFAQMVKKARNK